MNKVILLALMMPVMASGQVMETFESGTAQNWVQYPEGHWNTETSEAISGTCSLHHSYDNTGSGNDRAGFALPDLHPDEGVVKWSFKIRYATEPSSSNNWSVLLMSDSDSASLLENNIMNGFVVGVNQSGYDDTLRILKVSGGNYSAIVNSGLNWQNDVAATEAVTIDVERSPSGEWSLKILRSDGNLVKNSTGDNTGYFNGCFVVSYKYTSSRDRLLWLDDVYIDGVFHEDIDSPEVITVLPAAGDIIISEIMADPVPAVSLPPVEYIEILHRSTDTFNLKDCFLSANGQHYPFPEKIFGPGTRMIICRAQDTSAFAKYGTVTGLASFPVLTDGGKILTINDNKGNLIHGLEYSSDWYGNDMKKEGGWSMEMTDTGYPFFTDGNWKASESGNGGTPGVVNSVSGKNPDRSFPGITNVFPDDSVSISLYLSETVFCLAGSKGTVYIDGREAAGIIPSDFLNMTYTVNASEPLQKGKIYSLDLVDDIADFAGNTIEKSAYRFGLPETAREGDIVFNELLFNPLPGDPDYIELYNTSDKIIDASRLMLVSVSETTGDTSATVDLSSEKRCILPGEYYVITTGSRRVAEIYLQSDADRIFEISSLPSMPDDGGHLILYNRDLTLIDEVIYNEKMHYSLLDNYEGVSLEKVTLNSGSSDISNWHSASELSGWGTPGVMNSISYGEPVADDIVALSATAISPDNDGNDDLLIINLKLTGNGNVVTVTVFDETGIFVKKLTDNSFTGSEASVVWDGTADDGRLVNTGIYIMLISVFDDTGKTHKWKKVCTVLRR